MTVAICAYCGSEKLGAFTPCRECAKSPARRIDIVRSLILTDHFFAREDLYKLGERIRSGSAPTIDPSLERSVSEGIDDAAIKKLAQQFYPAGAASSRKRERQILLALMMMIAAGIGWMLYRFAFG